MPPPIPSIDSKRTPAKDIKRSSALIFDEILPANENILRCFGVRNNEADFFWRDDDECRTVFGVEIMPVYLEEFEAGVVE